MLLVAAVVIGAPRYDLLLRGVDEQHHTAGFDDGVVISDGFHRGVLIKDTLRTSTTQSRNVPRRWRYQFIGKTVRRKLPFPPVRSRATCD